ncbi:Transcription factor, fungi [Penicillium expansum]|nr:Transcription factor, fungi [Penicillium expansum]
MTESPPRDKSQTLPNRLAHIERRLLYLETAFQKQNTLHADNNFSSTNPDNSHQVAYLNNLIPQHVSDTQRSSHSLTSEPTAIRFINPSHWRVIMNNATRELGKSNYDSSVEERTIDVEPRSTTPILLGFVKGTGINDLLAALPPRKDADALVSCCFDSGGPALIYIHGPTFKAEYEEFWERPSTASLAWLALLFAIFSCGTFIQHSLIPGTAETALLSLIGLTSRVAIMMGYHRDPDVYPELSVFEREMRRRTWLVLVVLDHLIASQTGLLPVIQRGSGTATSPRNLLDDDLGPSVTILRPTRPNTETADISFMVAMEQILSMASEVTDAASGLKMTVEKTMELNDRLEATWNQISAPWNMSSLNQVTGGDEATIQRLSLGMTYERARCILHRQHLVSQRGDRDFNALRRALWDREIKQLDDITHG